MSWTRTVNIDGITIALGDVLTWHFTPNARGPSLILTEEMLRQLQHKNKKQLMSFMNFGMELAKEYSELQDAEEIGMGGTYMNKRQVYEAMINVADKYQGVRNGIYDKICDYIRSKARHRYQDEPTKKERKVERGFIYVIRNDKFYKIGKSKKPEIRFEALQIASPHKIKEVCKYEIDDYSFQEKELHRIYQDKRQSGEWFRLSDSDLVNLEAYLLQEGGKKHE